MASTYSDLKVELIGTGEQVGTWGSTTNTNFSTALGEAIAGSADVTFASADVDLTLTDTNATQTARNYRLNLTGTSGGARNLYLSSGANIKKPYIINNGLADDVTVRNKIGGTPSGASVTVPAGRSFLIFNTGTDVVAAQNYTPVSAGGTGQSTLTANNVILGNGTSPVQFVAPGASGSVLRSNGTTWESGGVPAAGSNTQVQFNASGSLTGSSGFTFNSATGTVTATTFSGALNGNASTATTASSATNATNASFATNLINGGVNQIPYNTGATTTSFITAPTSSNTYLKWTGSAFAWDSGGGGGTVTSVTSSTPTTIGVTGTTSVAISLTGTNVTNALGYTPYSNTNPSGYITSSSLSGYAQLGGSNSWSNSNTFGSGTTFNGIVGVNNTMTINTGSGGGIVSTAYNFTSSANSIFWTGSEMHVLTGSTMRFFVGSSSAGFSISDVQKVGGGTFNSYSDRRYKQDITPYTKSVSDIVQLNPVNYRYTAEFMHSDKPSQPFVGLIAQEVQQTSFADSVTVDAQGYCVLDTNQMIYALINSVKQLSSQVQTLQAEVAALKGA